MTRQTSSRNLKAIMGVALAATGLLLLFVNLDNATAHLGRPFASTAGSLDAAFELGLAGMRAAQAYFFEHSSFQSGVHQILVSFWPLILVIFGAALLQNAVGRRVASSGAGSRTQTTGVRK
ncbi:MAG TPA: hypothetical protein VE263_04010 [Candidatus Angelobacter sp.]|nr:hypothetical protein [Candidatus Angelobacter sp.]